MTVGVTEKIVPTHSFMGTVECQGFCYSVGSCQGFLSKCADRLNFPVACKTRDRVCSRMVKLIWRKNSEARSACLESGGNVPDWV